MIIYTENRRAASLGEMLSCKSAALNNTPFSVACRRRMPCSKDVHLICCTRLGKASQSTATLLGSCRRFEARRRRGGTTTGPDIHAHQSFVGLWQVPTYLPARARWHLADASKIALSHSGSVKRLRTTIEVEGNTLKWSILATRG